MEFALTASFVEADDSYRTPKEGRVCS